MQVDHTNATSVEASKGTQQWIKGYVGESEDPTEPLTAIYYPILDRAADEVTITEPKMSKTVGVLAL